MRQTSDVGGLLRPQYLGVGLEDTYQQSMQLHWEVPILSSEVGCTGAVWGLYRGPRIPLVQMNQGWGGVGEREELRTCLKT